mgnify:CR=1 FL=1
MNKDWIIREEDDKFNKGDLVLVKQYSAYDLSNPFGQESGDLNDILYSTELIEELLDKGDVSLGIITSKEITSWEPEAEMWMSMTMDKPYKFIQFIVYCFDEKGIAKTKRVDSAAMRLVSRGDIGRSMEESLNNLAKNNKQQ